MCGITGFISIARQQAYHIGRMTEVIRHRGPDDEGFVLFSDLLHQPVVAGGTDTPAQSWLAEVPYAPRKKLEQISSMTVQLALGHRRLSIIDLSPLGHQPMSYQNGRYWITYNGEIYNYTEIRAELKTLGHRFLSQSDTEVILAAFAQWGADCLHRFNGMWAFAIYDTQRREIFLARDRFGVKPLYYWVAPNGTFCFASEIKQFTIFPGWTTRVNPQRAYDFLVWGTMNHTDETLFAGVYQLPPGHSMRLQVESLHVDSKGRLPAEMWYKLNHSDFSGSFAGATIQFTHLFNDAVRLRMRADVPVGSCLSGGLDSSSIVCVMNKLLRDQGAKNPQKTFSACTCIERYDERTWIDEVVRATGVDAYYVYPSLENLFEELPAITWHQDEPFGSSSIYAQWNVFRLAAQNGVKVMLDGQGADEHLAGYREFFFARLAGLFYGGNLMRFWQEVQANKNQHGHSVLYSLANTIKILLPPSLKINLRRMKINQATPLWLNLDVLGAEAVNYTDNLNNYSKSVRALSYSQLTMTSIQTLLHCEDRDSMAHSIESRVPFLDYRLVEFVLGLPDEFKLSDGVTKRVLRKGMSGILPDRIRNRSDKLGFVTPEEIWVKEHAPALFRSKLQKAVDSSQGILSAKSICMLDDIIDARIPFDFRLWRMISFGEWMEVFSARN